MDWEDTLSKLYQLARPIMRSVRERDDITLENVWVNDDLKEVREKLSALLMDTKTINSLTEASKELLKKQRQLISQGDLTAEEIEKIGVLSATAYVLSAEAFASLITPKAVFIYTLKEVYPWMELLAKLAIVVAV
ncbi:MAG: hypothetical protein WCA08_24315 [Desulfoferrobacter sp.]